MEDLKLKFQLVVIILGMSSEPSYICDKCGMPFSSKGELEMHNEILHSIK